MKLLAPFVLASGSPRRRRLLEGLGLAFEVVVSDVEETADPALAPEVIVQHLAQEKAAAVAAFHPEALTLGADTIVVLENDILGKPTDESNARAMLRCLSGATHEVYTGIALLHPPSNRCRTSYEATRVTFGTLTAQEIDAYVASGSPMDKAGGYGIQDDHGALFVARIDGDYYNVVGLPLHRLYRLLRDEFTDLVTV